MDDEKQVFLNKEQGFDGAQILELKPITSGLGFKDRVDSSRASDQRFSADAGTLDIGKEHMDDGTLHINQDSEDLAILTQDTPPILFHSGYDGLIKRTAKKSGESFVGALIDVLFSVAFSILLVAFSFELPKNVINLNFDLLMAGDLTEAAKLLIVFSAIFLSYKIISRAFFGKSLGEWACRHQLGLYRDQAKFLYMFQVTLREVFCLATAIFVFPLFSALIRRDVGYYFSGLQTYIEYKRLKK